MKKGTRAASSVLTVRVPSSLDRKLTQEARRQRRTRGQTARAILESALQDAPDTDPVVEAHRQSRLASRRASEKDVLRFITNTADLRGWK